MNTKPILNLFGLLITAFSFIFLPPFVIGVLFNEGFSFKFLYYFIAISLLGLFVWITNRNSGLELKVVDGFIITALFWVVLTLLGAIPFLGFGMHPIDAFFESSSGITTTGASVLSNLESLPKSMLLYRQLLQWVGGMGLIILVVAIMPTLGIGGGQLFKMESPGSSSSEKLTPRIKESAKALWVIYLSLTVLCFISYYLAGMTLFDAISHALSTVSIGGFSTHDESIGFFNSFGIEAVCIFFMLLSAISFALHYDVFYRKKYLKYFYDHELRFFMSSIFIVVLLCLICILVYPSFGADKIRPIIFQSVSILTTSGFKTDSFHAWPGYIPFLLLIGAFIGACSMSVGGGIKSWRVLIVLNQAKKVIMKTIHPNAVVITKMGNKVVPDEVSNKVWGFLAIYVITFLFLLILVLLTGLDFETAFSAVGATINNLGPGLGGVSENYALLPSSTKLILSFSMILGRLEILTLLVLITPAFWRR